MVWKPGFNPLDTTDRNENMMGGSNPYLIPATLDTSSVYSKDPPGEDSGSVVVNVVRRGSTMPVSDDFDDAEEDTSESGHQFHHRNFLGCCGGGWTSREKVLLSIVVLNTIVIFFLLATNLAILRNNRSGSAQQASVASFGDLARCGPTGSVAASNSPGSSDLGSPITGASPQGSTSPYNGGTTSGSPYNSGSPSRPASPYIGSNGSSPTNMVQAQTPIGDTGSLCGCATCTTAIWNNPSGEFTCGQRISYLTNAQPNLYPTEVHACRRIAFEHPCACGGCDPGQCSLPTPEFILPGDFVPPKGVTMAPTTVPVNTPTDLRQEDQDLYCFPSSEDRLRFTLWDGMVVEIKEDQTKLCGPGDNRFSRSTVDVNERENTLALKFERGSASEVRILLPEEQRPYTYGEYSFSIRSIAVKDAAGNVKSDVLPKELVLGLFTWDGTEDYAVHENYNHEVDIEVSRWNCDTNSDLQFLVQPPGQPHMHRLFTGDDPISTNEKYKQGGQSYSFNWNPSEIEWQTTAGGKENNRFVLKTEEAIYRGTSDFIQCLPDIGGNMEVRLNLWNMLGARQPAGLAATDVVEVVIDDFSFTKSEVTHVPVGGVCSKHCQCEKDVALCEDHICTAK